MALLPAGAAPDNGATGSELPTLTAGEQVHQLSREEARRKYPAVIQGVVTCRLPELGAIVIQDATRGVYVDHVAAISTELPEIGELIRINGVTDPSYFAPIIQAGEITRLGKRQLPDPIHPTWDQLNNGTLDGQFVAIEGIVTGTFSNGVMLLTRGGQIDVTLYELDPGSLKTYEDTRVRIQGCVFASWNWMTHQLRRGEVRFYTVKIVVEEAAPADKFAAAHKRAAELLFYDPHASALRRVRVSGQILHQREGEYYLADGSNGLRFIAKSAPTLKAGDLVDIVGFPSLSGASPVLREAVVRVTGHRALPNPRKLEPINLFQAEYDSTRVQVQAVLLGMSANGETLELQAGLRRFLARVKSAPKSMPMGSLVEVTGVYAGHGANRAGGGEIDSFELLLNSPSDVRILARPPWWTLRRLLMVIAGLAAILTLALVWIRLLHQKVQQRTAQLQSEIREREHAEHQRALEQERSRIARDLHDDLGSSLTEIGMLATPGPGLGIRSDEACERLGVIAGKSRSLVDALDEIVWAVDPQRDTLASLARYLASYAEEYLANVGVTCRVQVPSSFPEQVVPGEVRHHLFLAVKEALNNAVRHGGGRDVVFRVNVLDEVLEISIEDNGKGFACIDESNGNGLTNLQERLRVLNGRCHIQSRPDRGTNVTLQVPVPARIST